MAADIVLFDLGGVLLPFDRERRVRAVVERLCVDPQLVRDLFASDLVRRLDLGQADETHFAAAFCEMAARPVTSELARGLILSVFDAPNMLLWTIAAALKHKVRVGCFSDNPTFVRDVFPQGYALEPMILSSQIGFAKLSPEAFAAAEARAGVRGDAIVFIDDGEANVAAARARGSDAIRFTSNNALVAALELRGISAK